MSPCFRTTLSVIALMGLSMSVEAQQVIPSGVVTHQQTHDAHLKQDSLAHPVHDSSVSGAEAGMVIGGGIGIVAGVLGYFERDNTPNQPQAGLVILADMLVGGLLGLIIGAILSVAVPDPI